MGKKKCMIPTATLHGGNKIPLLGLGTWKLLGNECTKVIKLALELGYRHLDTAHVYENHKAIKKGIEDFDRSKLFITSKLAMDQVNDKQIEKSVEKACDLALKELGVEYLDLYLLHWPDRQRPLAKILQAMHDLKKEGKIKSMGVSNFTIHHLQDALDAGIHMAVNQVELHPYLYQKDLIDFCKKHKIHITSYRPLGKGALIEDPLFTEIGKKHKKTPSQIILRWVIQKELSVIPKASSEKHLRENMQIFDFTLNHQEILEIDKLDRDLRYCDADWSEFNY
jgi:2,5-diketo-D-gluconate reductase B